MLISDTIRKRIEEADAQYFANHNIADFIKEEEKELLLLEVEERVEDLLRSLVIDTENDHNTKETAKRVSKMFLTEIFAGRYEHKPRITAFPNTDYDELYVTGPISIRSMCAHHMMPIKGKAYIGVFPGKNVIGLSKFNRLANWVTRRPQIQEEMTSQLGKIIQQETEAEGVAIIIRAEHFCMTHRGVMEHDSDMTTSLMLGKFNQDPSLKAEFLSLVSQMK